MTSSSSPQPLAAPDPATALSPRSTMILQRELLLHDLVTLCTRVFPAMVFWQSARTKVEGLSIKDSTYFLFEHVYALPVIPSVPAAILATVAEHVLPLLLIAGILARLSALGLLGMTAVIQIFVFPDAWVTHGLWATALLVTLAYGPGRLSLDHWLRPHRLWPHGLRRRA